MDIDTNHFAGHFGVMRKNAGTKPKKWYVEREPADKEAERLSMKYQGETFLVVQIVGRSKGINNSVEISE
jgi:hypothetical protein